MVIEVMPSEMIKINKDVSDVVKRGTLKETTWQKMSIRVPIGFGKY